MPTPRTRARSLIQQLAQGTAAHAQAAVAEIEHLRAQTDAHSRAVVAEFERLRAQTDAQATRALEDMRNRVSGVSQEVTQHLDSHHQPLQRNVGGSEGQGGAHGRRDADGAGAVSRRGRAPADRGARKRGCHARWRSASSCARSSSSRPCPPANAATSFRRARCRPAAPGSLTAAYAAQTGPLQVPPPPAGDDDGGWSLTDLLSRASRDDDGTERPPVVDMEVMARGLDPTTASAIWSRFRAGQRGIMVRSIYTAEGRAAFDDVTERYKTNMDLRRTVDRFLANFEGMIRDLEQKYPSGRTVHDHLISDAGRVYLLLAHASGRLR